MKLQMKDIAEILERVRDKDGGATLVSGSPIHATSGYQYSKTPNTETNSTESLEKAVVMVQVMDGNCGIWYNDGKFYIETSYWTEDLDEALEMGRKYGQMAIYDWKNQRDIKVNS